jgi:hypothetical protein
MTCAIKCYFQGFIENNFPKKGVMLHRRITSIQFKTQKCFQSSYNGFKCEFFGGKSHDYKYELFDEKLDMIVWN